MDGRKHEVRRRMKYRVMASVLAIVVVGSLYLWIKSHSAKPAQAVVTPTKECRETTDVTMPVDMSELKGAWYPGQVRDKAYRTYARLLVRSPVNDAVVKLPLSARLVSGRAYMEQGERQYALEFDANCNIRMRFDHLAVLSLHLADEVADLPLSNIDDLSMKPLGGKAYSQDEQIASRVGIFSVNRAWFDFGMYDFTKQNTVSSTAAWPKDSEHQNADALHAMCWIDLVRVADKQAFLQLPTAKLPENSSDLCVL